jgi:formylglycine-generating enzyme required for sulfatase activity
VGSYAANRFGLHDLGGNAREWCEDWFDASQKDRVLRGGSWSHYAHSELLSSCRRRDPPALRDNRFGFRCVLEVAPTPDAAAATKDTPFVNTLGMKFVPVPLAGGPTDGQRGSPQGTGQPLVPSAAASVLFSVWETRVQDYEVFARETKREWPKPNFKQGPTHPVVMVSWEDATAFCAWLTERERKAGTLDANERYRLPSDHEWSSAVGIADREDANQFPSEKNRKLADVYPWGNQWPPPAQAGNYRSEELRPMLQAGKFTPTKEVLPGYRDGHAHTAPVGSYLAGRFGLHELGGNAWEWCEDWNEASQTNRVLRGASWVDADPGLLLSSNVHGQPPGKRADGHGFRVVLAKSAPVAPAVSADAAAATKDAPFVNTLGMKFAPVPITGGATDGQRVLFSVWETRVQDYAVFASETRRGWPKPSFAQDPAHPVVLLFWDDAVAFCGWLTERERQAGKLAPTERYRLPSDHEWSCAVGIGEREDAALPPWEKHDKLKDVFAWGSGWPPPAGAGNFSGEETAGRETNGNQKPLTGYRDEFLATAPVGSFSPNRLGLYDLAGNVWEWCEEWCDATQKERLKRGGAWDTYGRSGLGSSLRTVPGTGDRGNSHGFRCVLEVK